MREFQQIQKFRDEINGQTIPLSKIRNEMKETSLSSALPTKAKNFLLARLESSIAILEETVKVIDRLNTAIEKADFEGQKKILEGMDK